MTIRDADPQGYPPFLVQPGDTAGANALRVYTAALSYYQDPTRGGTQVKALVIVLPLGLAIDSHTRLMAPVRARHPLPPGVDVDGLTCGDEAALALAAAAFAI